MLVSRRPLVHILSRGRCYSLTVSTVGCWLNECAGSKRESSKVMGKETETAFEKRLFTPSKSKAVRLNILLAMYLCRAAVVKI